MSPVFWHSQHKLMWDFAVQSAGSSAAKPAGRSTLLVYPFVSRVGRFSLLRSRAYGNTNQAPRSSSPRRLSPPHDSPAAANSGTPQRHRCGTNRPPAGGRTAAGKYFRCGRPPQSRPRADHPAPPLPLSRSTNPAAAPHAAPADKSTSHNTQSPRPAADRQGLQCAAIPAGAVATAPRPFGPQLTARRGGVTPKARPTRNETSPRTRPGHVPYYWRHWAGCRRHREYSSVRNCRSA